MTLAEAQARVAELRAEGLEPVQPQKRYAWMIQQANVPWTLGPMVERHGGIDPCRLWVASAAATIIMSGYCECVRVRLLQQGAEKWGALATVIVLRERAVGRPHVGCHPRFDRLPPARQMLGF